MTRLIAHYAVFLSLIFSSPALAEIVETQLRVPVSINLRDGTPVAQDVIVTRFQDNERKPSRFLIILHGRAGVNSQRRAMRFSCRRASVMAKRAAPMRKILVAATRRIS